MSAKTPFHENQVLQHFLGGTVWTMPTTLYLGLTTAGDAEPTIGANYARVAMTGGTGFGAPSGITNGREIANLSALSFLQNNSGSSHGTMTKWKLFDASTGGDALYEEALTSSFDYADGVQPEVAIGVVKVQITRVDDGGSNFEGPTDAQMDIELNHLRGDTSWTQPGTVTMALLTAITDVAAGTVTEVTGGSYARQTPAWTLPPDAEGTTVTAGRASLTSAETNFGSNDIGSDQSLVAWSLHDGTAHRFIFRDAFTWVQSATLRYPTGAVYLGAA